MSRHADTKSKSRSRLADWLPGGLLVAGVCAVGIYFTQNPAAFEQVRTALGFGPAAVRPEKPADTHAAATQPDPVEEMQIPASLALREEAEQLTPADNDESAATNFLPVSRTRERAAEARQTDGESGADLQLDRRFEVDQTTENSEHEDGQGPAVRTAELIESEAKSAPAELPEDPADIEAPTTPKMPPVYKGAKRTTSGGLYLTGGDDAANPGVVRRPARANVKASPAAAGGVRPLDLNEVRSLIEAGRDAEAYQQLSEAYFQYPSQRPKFQRELDAVAQRIYFTPQTQIQPPYEIQPGDQLRKIAAKYQLSWQYLSTLNQVDAKKIRAGKLLKVFQGPFEAKVDLSDFELTVMLNGQYVKRYPIGTGKMNSSPVGEFPVREKLENPTYYGPNGMVLEADDPQNPLGERWIDIGNSFGIHGTIEPDSIGKSESAGCIRMRNEDVAEVYDLLTVGSQVRIQR